MTRLLAAFVCLLGSAVLVHCSDGYQDPAPVIYPGQANIALLTELRKNSNHTQGTCGSLRPVDVRLTMAAVWAAHQVNFRKRPGEFNIGIYIYDSCDIEDVALRQTFRIVEQTGHIRPTACPNTRIPPIYGAIFHGRSQSLETEVKILESFSVPVIVASDKSAESLRHFQNVYSTSPSSISLARALVSIIRRLGWRDVAVISAQGELEDVYVKFRKASSASGVRVVVVGHQGNSFQLPDVEKSLGSLKHFMKLGPKAAFLFLTPLQAKEFLLSYSSPEDLDFFWIIVTMSDITGSLQSYLPVSKLSRLRNVFLVSPASTKIPEFHSYFQDLLKRDVQSSAPLVEELRKSYNRTNRRLEKISKTNNMIENGWPEEESEYMNDSETAAIVKAVWTLAFALKSVQQVQCGRGTDCLFGMQKTVTRAVLDTIKNMDFKFKNSGVLSLEGTSLHFTEDRHLATTRYSMKAISTSAQVLEIGWYSDESGLVVDQIIFPSTTDYSSYAAAPTTIYSRFGPSSLRASNLTVHTEQTKTDPVQITPPRAILHRTSSSGPIEIIRVRQTRLPVWISKPWSLIIVVLAGFGILLSLYIMVFLLMKLCEGVVRKGHQIVSVMQLLSVDSLFIAAILFTFKTAPKLCGAQQFTYHISFVFCFSCLLLKGMHLNSLRSVGLGGRVSSINQILTVCFMVGVQIATELQSWILKPVFSSSSDHAPYCHIQQTSFLLHEVYPFVLLLMAILMACGTRNTPYNCRDSRSLLGTTLGIVPVFAAGNTAFMLLSNNEFQSMALAFCLIATGYTIVLGIFGPQLYALHKHGGYQHKPLSYSESLSSAFTHFQKELEAAPLEAVMRGKKGIKLVEPVRMPNGLVRNPLYLPGSAYP